MARHTARAPIYRHATYPMHRRCE